MKTRVVFPNIVGVSLNCVFLFTAYGLVLTVTVVSESFSNACISFTIYSFFVVLQPKSVLGRLF